MINLEKLVSESQKLILLYVEDNADARESSMNMFEDLFPNIIIGVDGEDGLEKFKENKIDLIITDIQMPKMNGFEMVREIKKLDNKVPILVLSAFNESDYFLDSIRLGVEGYLFKPIDLDQFLETVSKTIDNIKLKKEVAEYQHSLEKKVDKQLRYLREKDKILLQQSKMATMGEMIDVIAHQWKQPLNIISMNNEILMMNEMMGKSVKPETTLSYNEKIQNQIEHLVSTIDEFRTFFRPNQNFEKINIKNILQSTILLIEDELTHHSIETEILCEDTIFIKTNANDIKHYILNMINNAIDKMDEDNIKNKKILLTCSEKDDKISLKIKDNGNGIPENIIGEIFKSHFTTKSKTGGTGMGLYMCNLIANKYDTKLEVYNDNGAVFEIKLPKL